MNIKNLTYRTQIFLTSLFLVITPSIILGLATANNTAKQINEDYSNTLEALTSQTNLTFDTLLSDAEKVGSLYLFNDEIRRILNSNYGDDMLKFAQDNTKISTQIKQVNILNTNVISCIIQNRYGYTFEYNILTYKEEQELLANIENWADIARTTDHLKYFGAVQHPKYTGNIYKSILPMIKVLYDPYAKTELGILYIGINFNSIRTALDSSKLKNSKILLFNADNKLSYCSKSSFPNNDTEQDLLYQLTSISSQITEDSSGLAEKIYLNKNTYFVSGRYNKTTGWKMIQIMDNSIVQKAYQQNVQYFFIILLLTMFFGLVLAFVLSRSVTKPIGQLCDVIDFCEAGDLSSVSLETHLSNRELQRLANSYNRLNQRLADSLKQNYTILLNEKQMKLRMLKSQINHHFLYNTLNIISSIANIHNIPEIRIVSNSMSDILRYNLQSGLIVTIKDEINQINQYMAIQKIRFPDKFNYEYTVPDELLNIEIPSFILQPIVENSFGHGFVEKESGCYINIQIYPEQLELHFLIADNGSGINSKDLEELTRSLTQEKILPIESDSSHSIGILNVHQRIRTYYGNAYGLSIKSSEGNGTIVEIILPQNQKPQLPFSLDKS